MRKKLLAVTAAAAVMITALPAEAVPVVNTYRAVSRFTEGPIAQITSFFTLSFDPSVTSFPATVTNYSSSVSDASFNPALVQFNSMASTNPFSPSTSVLVGGSEAGPGNLAPGSSDFYINFFTDRVNGTPQSGAELRPYSAATFYSLPTARSPFTTFDTTVTIVSSAVPEPGTWATFLLGFGAIGGALRVRRKRATTRVVFR